MRRQYFLLPLLLALLSGLSTPVGAEPVPGAGDPEPELVVVGTPTLSEPHIDFIGTPTEADIAEVLEAIEQNETIGVPHVTPAPTRGLRLAKSTVDFTLDYRTPIPDNAKQVFSAVMAEWSSALDMGGAGIEIEVFYQALPEGTLGAARNNRVEISKNNETFTVPTALVNALSGSDGYPWDSEIQVYVNSTVDWNFQTSGSIGPEDLSLYTTMLHEIGHGLGFWSEIYPETIATYVPSSFDVRIYQGAADESGAAPATPVKLSSNPTWKTGHSWYKNLDGTWERIYDPTSRFYAGSSLTHFDERTYGQDLFDGGALMTPSLNDGEAIYRVDNVTLGIMEAAGWKVRRPPSHPEILSVSVAPTSVSIEVSPNTGVAGPPAAQWEIVVKQGGETVGSALVDATKRSFSIPVFLPAGDYEVMVMGRGSGGASDPASARVHSTNPTPPAYNNCRQAPVNPTFATDDPTKASLFRLYCSYFLRNPDTDGFAYWYQTYSSGAVQLNEISTLFASSTEFALTYGSLSNEDFVNLVYNNVMERAAEPEGFQYWLGQISRGDLSRGEVMFYFSQSDEFKLKTGTKG